MNRRDLIRSGVAACTVGNFAVLGTAKRSFDEIYEQAKLIRDRTGSQKRFVQYLQKHTDLVRTKSNTFNFQVQDDDSSGVGTQKIASGDIHVDRTLTYQLDCNDGYSYEYIDYSFDIGANYDEFPTGNKGPDSITLSWNPNHYRTEEDT